MVSLFATKRRPRPPSKLEDLTLRGFGGGLNVVDDDVNMEAKFQTALTNFRRLTSGAQAIRFGYSWFADVADTVTGNIVDMTYFNGRIIAVTSTGQIATVSDIGAKVKIWSTAIAALLPGAPAGWTTPTQVDFVPFKDQLIIHNGIDKPITISAAFAVTYLQDLGTGSNVNVPIGKYGCVAANYHCVAGIAGSPTIIYISNKGTAGTFPSDPVPNDAISIDVGAYAPSGAPEILGIAGYRTKLIVFFRGQALIIQLGEYDTATTPNHVPRFDDEMPQFGLINHRCIISVENDLIFGGYDGLSSGKRNLFSQAIVSKFLSAYIEPLWRGKFAVANVTSAFLVYNKIEHASYMFVNDDVGTIIVFQANEQLKYEAWTAYEGLKFGCGCTSFLGRVFVANRAGATTRIYLLGNSIYAAEAYSADRLGDRDAIWAQSTVYTVGQLLTGSIGPIEVNGGFESGSTGWNVFGSSSIGFFGAAFPRTGLNCASVTRSTLRGLVSNPYAAIPAKDYTLSGYIKGDVASAAGMYFGLIFLDQSNVVLQISDVASNAAITTGYVQKSATITAPAGTHSVVIFAKNDGAVSTTPFMFVDDITLSSNSANTSPYEVLIAHTSPATGTFADELVNHPTRFGLWLGVPIDFTLEQPWTDGRNPMRTKHVKFISIDSRGTAPFTLSAYVEFDAVNAALAMDFVGNDATSGPRSNDPQLYEFPVKFKSLKTKISGSARAPLTIAAIRYLFAKGRYRR